jgi:hypothetical protein
MLARFVAGALAAAVPLGGLVAPAVAAPQPVAAKQPGPKKDARETKPPKRKAVKARLKLSPKNGAKVGAHPVLLTVRTGKSATVEAARLNGADIRKELRSTGPKRFAMTASASHRLRHGKNTLRVRVLAGNGKMRTRTSTFRVTHTKPLAGAGRDRTVAAGGTLRLKGTAISHPSKRAGIKRTWTVLRAPKGSALRRSAAAANTSTLKTADDGGARLRTDVPGTYRVRLTTTQNGRRTSDVMEADAVEAPMVPINTMVRKNGSPGIEVGGTFYPRPAVDGSGMGDEFAQILILDRGNLQVVPGGNKTAGLCVNSGCLLTAGDTEAKIQSLDGILRQLSADRLVIVSAHPGFGGTTDGGIFRELSAIGGPKPPNAMVVGGEVSLIGVPGMQPGDATYSYTPGATATLDGYFIKNRWDDYQFLDPRSSTFTTRIGRGCGAGGSCGTTFAVNGNQYSNAFSNAGAGYTVDVFDSRTLTRKDHDAFGTNGPAATAEAQRMIVFLQSHFGAGDLVMINSASDGAQQLIGPQATGDVAKRLAESVAAVGGTRHRFNTAAATAGQNYTLLGWGGAREGDGEEAVGQNPVVSGRLNPGQTSQFKPAVSSETLQPNDTLQKVLVQAPGSKPWPEAGNPAIAWIGTHTTPRLGSDPRTAYWTQAYDWASVSDSIDSLTWDCPKGVTNPKRCVQVPGANPGFTQEQFNRARETLSDETSWVSNIENYMHNFAAPYEKAATTEWEDTQTEAYTKFRAKPDPLQANPLDVLFAIVDFFEPFAGDVEKYGKELEKLVTVAATALAFGAMHLDAQEDGSSPDEELQIEADHLSTKLRDEAENTAASFDVMADILVSDYAKLSAIGPVAECNGGDSDEASCPAEFEWDKTAISATAAAAQRSAQREIYTELIPVQFPVWTIRRSKWNDSINFYCYFGSVTPFKDVQKAARIAALQEIYPDGSKPNQYDTYTIADVYSRYSVTNLDNKVLKQLFAPPPDSLQVDEDNDGLGLDPQDYARQSRSDDWPNNAYGCGWPDPLFN